MIRKLRGGRIKNAIHLLGMNLEQSVFPPQVKLRVNFSETILVEKSRKKTKKQLKWIKEVISCEIPMEDQIELKMSNWSTISTETRLWHLSKFPIKTYFYEKKCWPWKHTHLTENACKATGVTAEMHENVTFALHRIHVRRNFQPFIS